MEEAEDLVRRAGIALAAARFAPIARVTSLEYARIGARTAAAMVSAGPGWAGITSMGGAASTRASRRAAWSRWAHREVAAALDDLRQRRIAVPEALHRLRIWVPEAEATPACPGSCADYCRRCQAAANAVETAFTARSSGRLDGPALDGSLRRRFFVIGTKLLSC